MPLTPSRLSDFPYVRLRLTCVLCPRRGEYRLARLAARFGPETELGEVIYQLSIDCPYQRPQWRRPPRKYEVRCGVRLGMRHRPICRPKLAGMP